MKGTKITLFALSLIALFTTKIKAQGVDCSRATNVTIKTTSYRDYSFPQNVNAVWFSFVATSPMMDVEIATPINAADTPFVHIDSLIVYSGSCGKLNMVQSAVKTSINLTDTLPDIELSKLATGQTYYIKAVRFLPKGDISAPHFGLYEANYGARTVPTCGLSACGPNLVTNGDFETVPSWALAGTYQDSSDVASTIAPGAPINTYALSSPNMRFWKNFGGVPLAGVSNNGDFTDIYMITQSIGSSYSFNNAAESGSWFMAIDCPSNHCLKCSSTSPNYWGTAFNTPNYTCLAWQQTIPVLPGATYVFSAWIENADIFNSYGGAVVSMQINGDTPFFSDYICGPNYPGWTQVCYNWTAPAGVTHAKIQIFGQGAPAEGGRDFSLDNISFNMAQMPAITVNSVTSCPGATNTLTVSAGVKGATYLWSNGSTASSISVSPTVTTTYTVIQTVGNCQQTASGTITIDAPVIALSSTATCAGSCNATATATVTGGTAPYTYLWNNGQTTSSATGLCAGTDSVKVTDAHGCSITKTVLILSPLSPKIDVTSATVCKGAAATLSIDSVITGATYLWSNGATTSSITVNPTVTTTYSVTQTLGGCTATAITTITVDVPAVTLSGTPTCSNSCVGSLTASVTGGSTPYTYLWTGGATTSSATGLCAGLYSVFVTDANGCQVKVNTKVLPISAPKISVTSATICQGASATLTASGGSTSYAWSNGDSTATVTVSPTTTTSYTVTGNSGLCSNTAIATVTLYNRPTYTYQAHGTCAGECNGSVTFNVSGSTSPFTYSWATNGQTSTSASSTNLCKGNDTVFITDTHGCKLDVPFSIPALATPTVTAASDTICAGSSATMCAAGATTYVWNTGATTACITVTPLTTSTYNVTATLGACTATATSTVTVVPNPGVGLNTAPTCSNACNGSAFATVTGGTAPYTYSWSTGATTSNVSGLCPGSVVVTVTDAHGCKAMLGSAPTSVAPPVINVTSPTICPGTSATLTATGGSSYTWSNGYTTSSITVSPTTPTTYTVTSSTQICKSVATATVSLYNRPTYTYTTHGSCAGECNGGANFIVSGNTAPFTYSWAPNGQTSTSPNTAHLCAGTDTLTITDTHGCKTEVGVLITTIPSPTVTATSDTICAGKSAAICANGATTYAWSNNAQTACTNVTPVTTSTYQVTGTVGTCTATATSTVTVLPAPTICLPDTIKLCPNTCASLNAAGEACKASSVGLTYSWAPATGLSGNINSYVVTACPIKNTTYTVTATNTVTGCSKTGTVTVIIYPSPTYTYLTKPTCAGTCTGSATVTIGGYGAPYTYSWSPGGQTVASPTNLCAGYDTLTVTDVYGCTIKIEPYVKTAPTPTVTATSDTICAGNNATICAKGATTYVWNTGATTACTIVTPLTTSTYNVTGTLGTCTATATSTVTVEPLPTLCLPDTVKICPHTCASLSGTCNGPVNGITYSWAPTSGLTGNLLSSVVSACPTKTTTYTLTATNNTTWCATSKKVVIYVYPNPTIAITSKPTCANSCTGSLTATISGGNGPLKYSWAPGGATTTSAFNLCPGTYTLSVTDGNGCITTQTATVATLPSPTLTVTSEIICQGGVAQICANGATTYSWNTGLTTACINVSPLGTSTYLVTGTVGKCSATATSTVTVAPLPILCLPDTIKLCPNTCTTINVAGKVCKVSPAGLTYTWAPLTGLSGNTNSASVTACPTKTTTYTVTATNKAGCSKSGTITVVIYPGPTYTYLTKPTCAGTCTGSAIVTIGGYGAPYTYSWSPGGQTVASPTNLCVGYDTLTVGDVYGCSIKIEPFIKTAPTPTVTATSDTICLGNSASICAKGATTYVWNTGATTACTTVTPLSTSTYNVTGTLGTCTATATSTVTVAPLPILCLPDTIKLCPNTCTTINVAGKVCKVSPAGLTYTWAPLTGLSGNTNSASVTVCPTKTTTYTVTATNKAGCSKSGTITVVIYPGPTYTYLTKPTCAGTCTGSAIVSIGGYGAPYTYSWSPGGQTVASPTNLCAGYDTLTVGDAYGCSIKIEPFIRTAPTPTVTATSDTICKGNSANICAKGATTYVWSTGATTACTTVTPLSTSTYNVTGTLGTCTATATSTVTVAPLPILCMPDTIKLCPGSCTTLDVAGKICKASTAGVTYSWAPAAGLSATNSYFVTACPTKTTTYTVTATNKAGCSTTGTVTIVIYQSPTYTYQTKPTCAGTCNGSAIVNVGGYGAPFTYSWSPGGQTVANATNLCAGYDTLTITDVYGCSIKIEPYVKTAPSPTLTVTSDTICVGGIANICANGATTYTWNTGQHAACIHVSAFNTTVYNVTGTVGTCTATATSTLTVEPIPTICLPDTVKLCPGTCASLNAANGPCKAQSVGLTYSWAPATGLSGNTNSYYVTACPTQTTTYTVTATNKAGCSKTGTVTVMYYPRPNYTLNAHASCAGECNGVAVATVNGYDAPFTYSWSPGGQTILNATTLCPGQDTLSIIDKYGCTLKEGLFVKTAPSPTLTVNSDTICAGNSATICASGGTNYMWSIGSTAQCLTVSPTTTTSYPVTATGTCGTDSAVATVYVRPAPQICLPDTVIICPGTCASLNAANGPCKVQSVGLAYSWAPAAGLTGNTNSYYVTACPKQTTTYTVTATNAAGCSKIDSVTVVPATLPIYDYSIHGTCAGTCNGSSFIGLSNANYTFSWSPGGQTGNHPTNLCAGNDTVTITDTHGCTMVRPITIPTISSPTLAVTSDTICLGNSATICANGGTNYMWSIGSTAQCLTVSPTTTTSYPVTATGACGTDSAVAVVYVKPAPQICLPDTVIICPGTCASLNAANGPCKVQSVGLTYSWAPAAGLTGNTNSYYVTACPKQTTTYTVTATNAAGCSKIDSVTVVPVIQPIYDYSIQGACAGTCNGSAFIGLSPVNYTFSWSPGGQTGNHPTNLCAGNDTVTITDAHGCKMVRPITILTIPSPTLTVTSATICAGSSATICAGGGTNYTWNNGSTAQCLTVSPATTTSYTVSTNSGKCGTDTAVSTVYIAPDPSICLPDTVGVCPGSCASLNAACNGQTAGLSYSWAPTTGLTGNTSTASVTACPAKTTTYTVTATNAAGCSKKDSVTVVVYTHPFMDYSVQGTCAGACNGAVNTFMNPLIYTFSWSPGGQTVANPTNLCAGPDTLTAIDTHGCKRVLPVYIETIPSPTITATSTTICAGTSATICAGGGTNYTWSNGSTAQCLTVTPTVTTSYTVTTQSGKCGIDQAVSTVTVNNCPSIAPETKPGNLIESIAAVYPNPASTSLHISVNMGLNETDNLCIYNSVGEAVKCETLKDNLSTISTAELAAGIYFYRITDNAGNLIKSDKLMIVR